MQPRVVAKKIIDFNKASFDNTFDTITILQDHTEKMVALFLERASLFPEEGKKLIREWLQSCRHGSDDFKDAVNQNFKNVEDFFINSARAMDFMNCCSSEKPEPPDSAAGASSEGESGDNSAPAAADDAVRKRYAKQKRGAAGVSPAKNKR